MKRKRKVRGEWEKGAHVCTCMLETASHICSPHYPPAAAHSTGMQGSEHMSNSWPPVTHKHTEALHFVNHGVTQPHFLKDPPQTPCVSAGPQ